MYNVFTINTTNESVTATRSNAIVLDISLCKSWKPLDFSLYEGKGEKAS